MTKSDADALDHVQKMNVTPISNETEDVGSHSTNDVAPQFHDVLVGAIVSEKETSIRPSPVIVATKKDDERVSRLVVEQITSSSTRFHYGTHYSTAASTLFYLIRIEPFLSLSKELQGGHLDAADRLFHSISSTYQSCVENFGDVKELIPEFFYFPDFLMNPSRYFLTLFIHFFSTIHFSTRHSWRCTCIFS